MKQFLKDATVVLVTLVVMFDAATFLVWTGYGVGYESGQRDASGGRFYYRITENPDRSRTWQMFATPTSRPFGA